MTASKFNCTGTDNQRQANTTLHTPETQKRNRKNCPSEQNLNPDLVRLLLHSVRKRSGPYSYSPGAHTGCYKIVLLTYLLTNFLVVYQRLCGCVTGGGLGLAIEGPSKAEIQCKDNKDGTATVTYVPPTPGEYKIVIKYAGQPITDTPYFAKISAPCKYCSTPCLENTECNMVFVRRLRLTLRL